MADSHAKNHDYHLVDPSPWPVVGSIGALILAIGSIYWMHSGQTWNVSWAALLGFAIVFYTMFMWWRDIVTESHKGDHTPVVQLHLRYGMLMFIASEIMFFVAWFWAFFKFAIFPMYGVEGPGAEMTTATGPDGVFGPLEGAMFDPWDLPLINTLILLLSGCTVTWAHHALIEGGQGKKRQNLIWGLLLTCLLGGLFTAFQAYEYSHASFSFKDDVYGAVFFMATGFHGFHVIVGTIFLTVCLLRARAGDFKPDRHVGFEAAAWYWHFVDVVWLFLFAAVYIWGG